MRRTPIILFIALLLAVLAWVFLANRPQKDLAPNFSLPDLQEKTVSLQNFRGKVVLLNFWATWCPYCVEEMGALEAAQRKYSDKGFTILAINVMSRETKAGIRAFVEKGGYSFPVLLDTEGRASEAYGIYSIPASYLIDGQGRVRWVKHGPLTEEEIGQKVEQLLKERGR
ncbi:MAG: cytochrome c biosis protein CcmG, thiol:disulfide interchange protein DsbE [Clostridia bacterium]|nr:cytochrome c biosis protein CcmG, thiol:disulfide interchange protein DsbE [Clostridia bacterium]